MLICHLYIFFVRCLFTSSAQVLIGLFVFYLLGFKWSLHILNASPLSDVRFAPGGVLLLAFKNREETYFLNKAGISDATEIEKL